jgi:hypothetical protein
MVVDFDSYRRYIYIYIYTFESMASMTEIFEETLDPPTMAAKGLFGTSTAPWR